MFWTTLPLKSCIQFNLSIKTFHISYHVCTAFACYRHIQAQHHMESHMTDLACYSFGLAKLSPLINYAVRIKPNKGCRLRSMQINPTQQPCFDLDPNIDGYSVWRLWVMPYLCCCINTGSQLQQLSNNLHMPLFGGQMKSIQTILRQKYYNQTQWHNIAPSDLAKKPKNKRHKVTFCQKRTWLQMFISTPDLR